MTTGTIVTMVTSVVTVATVSFITMATLVAVCPRTRRKGLAPRTFSVLLFFITVTQLVVKGYS
jgi:steroid 5-alpha reductase family enzyme